MVTDTHRRSWFVPKLEGAIAAQGTSIRALARALRPDNPEAARRSLHRYLAGRVPPAPQRRRIAEALGVDPSTLEPDTEDDEEADLLDAAHALDRAGEYALADRLRGRAREVARSAARSAS